MYGLREKDLKEMEELFLSFNEIEKVILFGSRAMGNYKVASDVDLVLYGEKLSSRTVLRVSGILNDEKLIPLFFDVLNFNRVSNMELKKHIEEFGEVLFERVG